MYIPIRLEWFDDTFHPSFIFVDHTITSRRGIRSRGLFLPLSRARIWKKMESLTRLPSQSFNSYLRKENKSVSAGIQKQWRTSLCSLSVERLLMFGGKHDSSYEWLFERAVGTLIHCSFPCLVCLRYDWKHNGGHHAGATWGKPFLYGPLLHDASSFLFTIDLKWFRERALVCFPSPSRWSWVGIKRKDALTFYLQFWLCSKKNTPIPMMQ